ncbi:Outer membrane lipoprotein-sorting protein [Paenibacillaceae bacterium GAS479]|nr:Outer membrane lipoprotein-sorting protein [Paenibacillaceae bacterium GAS479]
MRRMGTIAALMACFILLLAGCGKKDAGSVVKDLGKLQDKTETYQGTGIMTLHTATQPLQYKVDVKFQKPNYYRIALTNEKKDLTQIVLRNDEGVFVLTPSLNKVFRFQSNWPEEQGQVYLYQTLVQSILKDNSRQFADDKDSYVFDVMANYQNASLARQKIWLNKSDYSPKQVEVLDSNAAVLVDVKFDTFKFNEKLDKSVFDTKVNLQSSPASGSEPTTAVPEGQDGGAATGTEAEGGGKDGASAPEGSGSEAAADPTSSSFIPMEPSYLGPEGIALKDSNDIEFGGNPGVMFRYDGTYSYTLIETQPEDYSVATGTGEMVNLGFTVGQLSIGQEQQTLAWTYMGTEFRLTSDNLPEDELIKVAQSVVDEMTK